MNQDIRRMKMAIKQQACELEKLAVSIEKRIDKKMDLLNTRLEKNIQFLSANAENIDYLHALLLITLRTMMKNDRGLKLLFVRTAKAYLSNDSKLDPELSKALDVIIKLAENSGCDPNTSWKPRVIEGGCRKNI